MHFLLYKTIFFPENNTPFPMKVFILYRIRHWLKYKWQTSSGQSLNQQDQTMDKAIFFVLFGCALFIVQVVSENKQSYEDQIEPVGWRSSGGDNRDQFDEDRRSDTEETVVESDGDSASDDLWQSDRGESTLMN